MTACKVLQGFLTLLMQYCALLAFVLSRHQVGCEGYVRPFSSRREVPHGKLAQRQLETSRNGIADRQTTGCVLYASAHTFTVDKDV